MESHVTSWFECSSKNTYRSFLDQDFHFAGTCVRACKFIACVLLLSQVYLKAPMILNGVCVIWKGWIDLQRLDGMGCLEFDEERAQVRQSALGYLHICLFFWRETVFAFTLSTMPKKACSMEVQKRGCSKTLV